MLTLKRKVLNSHLEEEKNDENRKIDTKTMLKLLKLVGTLLLILQK